MGLSTSDSILGFWFLSLFFLAGLSFLAPCSVLWAHQGGGPTLWDQGGQNLAPPPLSWACGGRTALLALRLPLGHSSPFLKANTHAQLNSPISPFRRCASRSSFISPHLAPSDGLLDPQVTCLSLKMLFYYFWG